MKILSLFDGIACGYEALQRAGIHIDKYYASEIDKYAIQIAKKNHEDIIEIGDVTQIKGSDYQDIDLIIGGSPCQGFSLAGKQLAFDDPRSKLFFEFVRLVKEIQPKYFLLENVKMKKEYVDIISDQLGVQPIEINSCLVSAQNRKRLYWTNIPGVELPKDRGIMVKDILQDKDYIYCTQIGNSKNFGNACGNHKAYTLRARQCNGILTSKGIRKFTPVECERLQTLPDNYTEGISDCQRYKALGNGRTVDVIAHIFSFIK